MTAAGHTADILSGVSADWYTAAELAEMALPGLPGDKRALNRRIADERWALRTDRRGAPLARKRAGHGGGFEYHISLLPGAARLALARFGHDSAAPVPEAPAAIGSWRWYEGQSAKIRSEAERRLAVIRDIDLLEEGGQTRSSAIAEACRIHGVGSSTVWNWLKLVEGVARADWLPALAPRFRGGGKEAEVDPLVWQAFKSDFLRLEEPTMTSCYARAVALAKSRGLPIPSERTLRRKVEKEIDPRIILLRRGGEEKLRRSLPAQRRTVEHLHALEHVNIDGHKFDVFVRDGDRVFRPIMVAIQDIYSSKIVAFRVGETESAVMTRLAFADLFEKFGIPKACTLDNGRAFASKWITGGAKTRFRFKIREEEPTGLLTALGIRIHWALPYRGQSKPIERAFRDLCDTIARHPAMAGAYTGNTPLAKPENYGSKAVPLAEFLVHVEEGIAFHNARLGRRGRDYRGRSFDQVFAESYATAPIGKATPEQLRMALLAAEQVLVDRRTGEVQLYGNRYWSEGTAQIHGKRVTVRFDPDNLVRDVHLYDEQGRYLTSAELINDTGFDDVASAKESGKRLAEYRKTIRAAAQAEQLLDAEAVAALQPRAIETPVPAPAVLRPVRHRGQTAAALQNDFRLREEARLEVEDRVFSALRLVADREE